MNLWIVTNLEWPASGAPRASAIQNLRTAAELARRGHKVLLWTKSPLPPTALELTGAAPLQVLVHRPRGPRDGKKTPFATPWSRLVNLTRAAWRTGPPDAVICRSPTTLEQLHRTPLLAKGTRLILEYQYPEYAELWRAWRKRNPAARAVEAIAKLRTLKLREDWIVRRCVTGILHAANGHASLFAHTACRVHAMWFPSAAPDPETSIAEGTDFDLGYVGGLAPENGVETLLEALVPLPGKRLAVVGDGPARTRLERRAGELGVTERVLFAGAVPPGEVRTWMRRCRAGVAPFSARCGPEKRRWSSPLKIVEWMAAGVPICAGAIPSAVDLLGGSNGVGILHEPDNPASLAGALGHMLADEPARRVLAEKALARAGGFTFAARAARIEKLLADTGLDAAPPCGAAPAPVN